MRWLRVIQRWFRGDRLSRDIDDELAFHLEMREREFVKQGMSLEEARRAARRRFGNGTLAKEDSRQVWGFRWLEELGQDLRFAFRSFRKNPGSTATAVITLALGLGVGTAVFSVVNALLFKPLQYKDPDRLVMVWSVSKKEGVDLHLARRQGSSMSTLEIEDWKKSGVFESMVAFRSWGRTILESGEPEGILSFLVTPGFFEMTGIQPMLGRGFLPEEEPMGGRNNVLVITHEFWKRRYQQSPDIVGQEIVFEGRRGDDPERFEIIGVLPRGFSFFSRQTDMITPMSRIRGSPERRWRNYRVLARLKEGLSLEQVQAQADVFSDGLAGRYPKNNEGWKVKLVPVAEDAAGHLRPAMYALLAAVLCVLFIACSNVANLFLVQFASRSQELSMRYALGASRMRVLRQLLTESMLLSISGGVLGFAMAVQLVPYFRSLVPAGNTFWKYLVQIDGIEVDTTLALFAVAVTVLAGILIVVLPVLRSSQFQLESTLRDAGRTALGNRGGRKSHDLLITAEVAVAVVLVVAAGLLVRSIAEMYKSGPGFDPENVTYIDIQRADWRVQREIAEKTDSRQKHFYAMKAWEALRNRRIRTAIESLPGIESVGVGAFPFMNYYRLQPATAIDGRGASGSEEVLIVSRGAGEGYFKILRIPLLRGRTFNSGDFDADNIVVNELLAESLWPDSDPTGKRLKFFDLEWTVVGVVGNVRQEGMHKPAQPVAYLPTRPGSSISMVRSSRDLDAWLPEVRRTVKEADPTAYVGKARPLSDAVLETIWRVHFSLVLLGGLSALALILALVGLYSTLSYIVRGRTGEIGLRMALGASQRDVLSLVLRHGLTVVGMGLFIGLIGSAALTRFLSTLLFGVTPTDPLTFVSVACAITATALVAAYLPARRASKVDPMVALRHE